MKEKLLNLILEVLDELHIPTAHVHDKIKVDYAPPGQGDYASNVAMTVYRGLAIAIDSHVDEARWAGQGNNPREVAEKIKSVLEAKKIEELEKIEVAGPGFINFTLKKEELIKSLKTPFVALKQKDKILLEYFQPNIAKPLHVGHLRTAIIGDALKRMMLFLAQNVESDTHMGDWGTQFGMLIASYKNEDDIFQKEQMVTDSDSSAAAYTDYSRAADDDDTKREIAKQEFVKLERGDPTNRDIWKKFVDSSVKEFLEINELMGILPFEHHWPESFYEDKMPAVLEKLKSKGFLKESQGAQVVDLEDQKLGIAVIVKSDGGTTYLLRDLAAFIFVKKEGFKKHLYVVDNRQSHHYRQLFAILKLMGEMPASPAGGEDEEGIHIDYGFMSFKGEALSTRKGNMVLADDVISQAEEKVAKVIAEKNPDLKNKANVVKAVSKGAIKYFDLKHNRHSDIEFDWDEVLDFEGDSGPYLQYAHARLASILRKAGSEGKFSSVKISDTEREVLFKSSLLAEVVDDSLKDYLPNVLANYLYNFATLLNKFYHESPVIQEKDENIKKFRLALIAKAKDTLKTGLGLLGIEALDEM